MAWGIRETILLLERELRMHLGARGINFIIHQDEGRLLLLVRRAITMGALDYARLISEAGTHY
jgi:hypothetical protein